MRQKIPGGWFLSLNHCQNIMAEPWVPWLQLVGLFKLMSKVGSVLEVMPRCAADVDAKTPCTKRAPQRASARFVNALTAFNMHSNLSQI